MSIRLPAALGNDAVGDAFFGRDAELDLLLRRLRSFQHVTLVAQRRMGKTSVCKEAARRYGAEFSFFYVDLQDKESGADAVAAIAASAREHIDAWTKMRTAFSNLLGNVESVGNERLSLHLRDAIAGDWRPQGERVIRALEGLATPAVLVLDELPILLTTMMLDREGRWRPGGREAAAELLDWLRAMCIASQGRVVVVVTGSIGLGPVAARAGASGALNHYADVPVGPWEAGIAMDAARGLAASHELVLDDDAAEEIVSALGSCIPYHVQLLVDQIAQDALSQRRSRVSRLDVQRVYRHRILTGHGHTEAAHMEQRLLRVLPVELRTLAMDLLSQAAVRAPLTVPEAVELAHRSIPYGGRVTDALNDVISVLEHDEYLQRGPEGWRFVSTLHRDWWCARAGVFFQPAAGAAR